MKHYLSPSLMCCDLLNVERDLHILEKTGMDMIHYDIMDTSFTTGTMLPALMLERVARTTNLPMDVHIMSLSPECYFPQVLPWCRGGYVSIHAEGLRNLPLLLSEIRNAGVGAGVALNAGTPLCCLEEVAPLVDMVVLINGVAGCNRMKLDIDSHMENRIRRTRALLDRMGRTHALLSVDGNISLDNARRARRGGANTFVLGTASIFRPERPLEETCLDFRTQLENEAWKEASQS